MHKYTIQFIAVFEKLGTLFVVNLSLLEITKCIQQHNYYALAVAIIIMMYA